MAASLGSAEQHFSAPLRGEDDNVSTGFTFVGDDPRPFSYLVEGLPLPPTRPGLTTWDDHISSIRQMEIREDDILLCTYPRSGTHWLWEIACMVVQAKAEYSDRCKEQLMLEFVDVKVLTSLPSPRLLNTHLPFSMLPWRQIKEKKIRVVHVYRNPKDAAVSYYHMLTSLPDRPEMAFDDFVNLFCSKKAVFGSYFDFLRQVAEFQANNPEVPMLSLAYEDMKKNPVATVERLACFLGTPLTSDLCEGIANACSFQQMQNHMHVKNDPDYSIRPNANGTEEVRTKPNFPVFRKGEIGDWKNYFTMALNERMDAIIEEEMKGLPFALQFS